MIPEYVIFDLDGTLTDSQEGILNAVAYSLEKLGLSIPSRRELLLGFIGPPLMDSYMGVLGLERSVAERAVEAYREYYSQRGLFENRVYDGIPELLAELKSRGFRLAVATSKPEPYSLRIMERFELSRYFELIAGASMDESRGRKSEVLEYAVNLLGIADRSRAVMVGDRWHDAEGAAKCGLRCIGVLYGFGDRAELEKAGATAFAETPAQILPVLLNM